MGFRSLGCIDPSIRITYPMTKTKTTSKQAEFNYKLPHNSSQNPLQPTKSPRRGPSAWETCGMNGKSCLVWAETATRSDHMKICTYCLYCASFEAILMCKLNHRSNVPPTDRDSVILILDPSAAIPSDGATRSSVLPSRFGYS